MPTKPIKFQKIGELFSGPGGGGLGASMAKIELENEVVRLRHVWATDYDQDSCDTYSRNMHYFENTIENFNFNQPIKVVCDDVNNLDLEEQNSFERVDGLLFGFPCNDFSLVGETKGFDGKFGPLYKNGIRVLSREDNPDWFIAENVGGITSANEGMAFKQILSEMKDAGYALTAHKYRFEEYGVPQARHRVIVVGIRKDLGKLFSVPKPVGDMISAGEALADIPSSASHQERTKQSATVVERLNCIKPGQNVWNADLPEHLKLKVKGAKLSHIYKRLEKDKPSYTITGSGGGGTHVYHWEEPRALTNRERARLQTFPDWYNFSGSKESVRKQIGMAIPPVGIKIICEAILKTLYDISYESVNANIDIGEILDNR